MDDEMCLELACAFSTCAEAVTFAKLTLEDPITCLLIHFSKNRVVQSSAVKSICYTEQTQKRPPPHFFYDLGQCA